MSDDRSEPGRWWNAVFEIRLPFDTEEQAVAALQDGDTTDRLFDVFGRNASIGGTVEEAVVGVWPY